MTIEEKVINALDLENVHTKNTITWMQNHIRSAFFQWSSETFQKSFLADILCFHYPKTFKGEFDRFPEKYPMREVILSLCDKKELIRRLMQL